MNDRTSIAIFIVASAILIGTGWKLYRGENFRRPLEGDEAISLEYYTWAGVEPDGQPHRLRRMTDYYGRSKPNLELGVLGLYCSLGRWTEPNNHMLNSLMMDLSLAISGRDEKSARLPALGFTLLLGGLFVLSCKAYLGSAASALPILACFLWSPYLLRYSQEARGYSAMLALQTASLLVAIRVVKDPNSLLWGGVCALLCFMSIFNMINLAVDWVPPFYLALLLVSWSMGRSSSSTPRPDPVVLRKNLLVQVFVVGFGGFIFLVSHLPSVVSSLRQYGSKVDSLGHLLRLIRQAGHELFPTPSWLVFASLGLVGLLLVWTAGDRGRFLLLLTLLTVGISLAHFAGSRRFPYPRTLGYVLPLLFLGAANVVRLTVEAARTPRRRSAVWAAWACGSIGLIGPSFGSTRLDEDRQALLQAARDSAPSPGTVPTYVLMGAGLKADSLIKYLPPQWLDEYDDFPAGRPVRLAWFARDSDRQGVPTEGSAKPSRSPFWDPTSWARPDARREAGALRFLLIDGSAGSPGDPGPAGRALVFWYPDPQSVMISPSKVLELIDRSDLRYLTQSIRHQVKLDSFGRLRCVILIAESAAEARRADELTAAAIGRFGGWSVIFRPADLKAQ